MSTELRAAINKLLDKSYSVENQFDGFFGDVPGEFQISKECNILIDHLSEAQVIALSNML